MRSPSGCPWTRLAERPMSAAIGAAGRRQGQRLVALQPGVDTPTPALQGGIFWTHTGALGASGPGPVSGQSHCWPRPPSKASCAKSPRGSPVSSGPSDGGRGPGWDDGTHAGSIHPAFFIRRTGYHKPAPLAVRGSVDTACRETWGQARVPGGPKLQSEWTQTAAVCSNPGPSCHQLCDQQQVPKLPRLS